jgi:hypothetical protein
MAEGFELVRTVRLHLRRSATLLDEGKFDQALAAAESALAVDPQSLAAQALCDRIMAARAGAGAPAIRAAIDQTSRSFVPQGVNAASWHGFEQRITERRFKAMLDTINTSIVAGDAVSARAALEEARELRPDAAVLADFEARVAALPVAFALPAAKPAARIWVRAMGAAALFLIGVSLLLGLEWMRPGDTTTIVPPPVVAPEVPAVAPAQRTRPVPAPDLGPVPVALNEESVPAIITPPEPLMRPTATTGTTGTAPPTIAARSFALREASPPVVERTIERRPVEEDQPSGPLGEVADDFVASRSVPVAARDAGPAMVPAAAAADTPVTADARGRAAPPAATPASAISVPSGPDQQVRVQEVLRRYARAYGQLDASAARAVWPSVDERALARAFQNLSSQQVSFDDCEIDIRGAIANASCRGQASYAPKIGKREQRTEPRTWRFELHRDGDAWTIENVDMRRAATGYR